MHCIGCDLHSKRTRFCLVDGNSETSGYPLPAEAILLEGGGVNCSRSDCGVAGESGRGGSWLPLSEGNE
jgi:hypothetical protein